METLGSIIDKFSIAKLRYAAMSQKAIDQNKINLVHQQIQSLRNEIDAFLFYAIKGEVKLEEPKFKFYKNENASGENHKRLGESIERLFEANHLLWNLEDKRRDTNYNDKQIREICDDVAKYNRVRNDMIDEINKNLSNMLNNN